MALHAALSLLLLATLAAAKVTSDGSNSGNDNSSNNNNDAAASDDLVPSKDLHEMLGCCQGGSGSPKQFNSSVRLGYLTAVMGDMRNRQGRAISGALSYAIEQVNTCDCLLPDTRLEFTYNDTQGLEPVATAAIVDLICRYSHNKIVKIHRRIKGKKYLFKTSQ